MYPLFLLHFISTIITPSFCQNPHFHNQNMRRHYPEQQPWQAYKPEQPYFDLIQFPVDQRDWDPYYEPRNEGWYGTTCYSYYGTRGVCVDIVSCPSNSRLSEWNIFSSCGFYARSQLICCTETSISSTLTPKPKPYFHQQVKPKVPGVSYVSTPMQVKTQVENPANTSHTGLNSIQYYTEPPAVTVDKDVTAISLKCASSKPGLNPEISKSEYDNNFNFSSPESAKVCGVYNSNQETWPWLVTIGRQKKITNTIEWICLGSLITTEYILTTANCIHRSPDIVAIGNFKMGMMKTQYMQDAAIRSIAESFHHEKYVFPTIYKNIGLIRISMKIQVTSKVVPICFPFLAGVLDIIQFSGAKVKTIGYEFPVDSSKEQHFGFQQYKILNNTICSSIFQLQKHTLNQNRYPDGINSDNMCGLTTHKSPLCQVPGAPLVIYDNASSSFVVIGISSGDTTCSEFRRQIVTFTRVNSYSSWLREHVNKLPSPPPCYI